MTVEPIDQRKGVSRAKIICDGCGRDEVVACAYSRPSPGNPTEPNQAQARAKSLNMGWTYVKGKMRCPACEAKRKVVKMSDVKTKQQAVEPREPSKKQRIQIFTMLAEVYDIDAGRYMQGDTDDTVADVLGVLPGWVSQIREAEFGPDGGNEDFEALAAELAAFRDEVLARIKRNTDETDYLLKARDRIQAAETAVTKMRRAIGPRNVKRAGV